MPNLGLKSDNRFKSTKQKVQKNVTATIGRFLQLGRHKAKTRTFAITQPKLYHNYLGEHSQRSNVVPGNECTLSQFLEKNLINVAYREKLA